jgi:hypothetical protein
MVLAFLCYRPGLEADFHFDDRPSLAGIEKVDDGRSAVEFTLSGITGPLGRPLALASFLVNQSAWPDDPAPFLYTNLLLHLINGLLLAWLVLRVCQARGERVDRTGLTAALTATVWMVMPILASTSLLVIQRMTSLSATFVLLGLVCYLLSRAALERRPGLALGGMSASLAIFTLLAVLTKENGALLPVFALVVDSILLPRPERLRTRTWRLWRSVFLWLPPLAIVGVLISMVPYSEATSSTRGFGAWERLITQASILWEYLFHAFIPADTTQLGPFQDTQRPARSLFEPLTLLAVAGWVGVTGAAWRWRHIAPIFSFAVIWYLAGHLLESTVVPLDLYFEHRNYLPLIGPVFAISWGAVNVPRPYRKLTTTGTAAYVGLLALTLWLVASQWGHPLREAQEQYAAHPTSSRAVGYFSAHLLGMGLVEPATAVLDRAIERGVASERLRVTKLYLRCRHSQEVVAGDDLPRLRDTISTAQFDRNLAHALYVLTEDLVEHDCDSMKLRDARRLIEGLAANPLYQQHGESRYWLHRAKAELAASEGKRQERKSQLRLAQDARFDPFALEQWMMLQAEDGRFHPACEKLQHFWNTAPMNPVKRLHRYLKLSALAKELSQQMPRGSCQLSYNGLL